MANKKAGPAYPSVGKAAPAFALPGSNGRTVRPADFKGKRAVVLFFYPRDNTSGCTREACGFRDGHAAFKRAGVEVLGVSPDSLKSHDKFIAKHDLSFTLLADEEQKAAGKYGVWQQKSMSGRKYMGIVRTTFVIDKAGKVAHVFEKVKPDGHHEQVLAWIKENL